MVNVASDESTVKFILFSHSLAVVVLSRQP
jgi:hypothetical protein